MNTEHRSYDVSMRRRGDSAPYSMNAWCRGWVAACQFMPRPSEEGAEQDGYDAMLYERGLGHKPKAKHAKDAYYGLYP